MTHPIRLLCLFLALALTALIGWASWRGDFGAEFAAITAMPWGQVTLADLYLGFFIYGLAVKAKIALGIANCGFGQCMVADLDCCAVAQDS